MDAVKALATLLSFSFLLYFDHLGNTMFTGPISAPQSPSDGEVFEVGVHPLQISTTDVDSIGIDHHWTHLHTSL